MERRLAARHAHELDVELRQKSERVRLRALDVSRHGLFIATDRPAPLHHALLLTVRLRGGPFETMATVVRRVVDDTQGTPGMGLKLFCLGAEAKARWDLFVASLDQPGLELPVLSVGAGGAVFLVQLDTVAGLYEFFVQNVLGSRTLYLSPAIRQLGAPVQIVLVHPDTHEELTLRARVVDWNADRPVRMGIRFDNLERESRLAIKRFIGPVAGAGTLSMPDGPPLVARERPRWTEYAYYSPKIRPMMSEPSGEILLLDDEVVSVSNPPSPADLDLIEGELLEHPELELVDKRALFDFNWSNDDDDTKP